MAKPPRQWVIRQTGCVGDKPTFTVFNKAGRIASSGNRRLLELMGIAPEIVGSLRALVDALMQKNNLNPEQDGHLMEAQELLLRVEPLVADAYRNYPRHDAPDPPEPE